MCGQTTMRPTGALFFYVNSMELSLKPIKVPGLSFSGRTKQWLFGRRSGNLTGFLICVALLSYAYYLQYAKGLEPCPLCMLQRLAFFALAIAFLVAATHRSGVIAARAYGVTGLLIAAAGAAVSARHVWLQHTPESKRPACGPGFDFLMDTFGPLNAVKRILHGSGECGAVDWTFLGLSIPEWTLLAFIALGVYAVILGFRPVRGGERD